MSETVARVVRFAVHAIGCSDAGVVLAARPRGWQVGAVTSPVVAELYLRQLEGCAGPLIAALGAQDAVEVGDTAAVDQYSPQWSQWAGYAVGLGVRSIVHVPLPAARPLGVLSLISTEPNAFDRDDIAVGHILARHAAVAVAYATKEQNLRAAIDARKLIGQAQGMLMERYNLDDDQAFAVLRCYSQDHNIKLRDVVARIIDTRELPEPITWHIKTGPPR